MTIELLARLLCINCKHSERLRGDFFLMDPDEWMHCPYCGPLEQIFQAGGGESAKAKARNAAKGGVVIRGRPRTIC
jgi:hypothetical protein